MPGNEQSTSSFPDLSKEMPRPHEVHVHENKTIILPAMKICTI